MNKLRLGMTVALAGSLLMTSACRVTGGSVLGPSIADLDSTFVQLGLVFDT